MKKILVALAGIIVIASATLIYSCSKEDASTTNAPKQPKVASTTYGGYSFTPHFIWKQFQNSPCTAQQGFLCGYNVTELTGDEACWLMTYENDPWRFYLPTSYLLQNNAGMMLDSAAVGSITFDADCVFESDELRKLTNTEMIPAGRYQIFSTTYNGESVVCIRLDTIL
jgi:hypothetical protein